MHDWDEARSVTLAKLIYNCNGNCAHGIEAMYCFVAVNPNRVAYTSVVQSVGTDDSEKSPLYSQT